MKLGKIQAEDLQFTGEIEDDRTNTYLTLDDYDWMDYRLKTKFKTALYGDLQVDFWYFGANFSTMTVAKIKDNVSEEYEYIFSSDIFVKYIKQYLSHHLKTWDSKYAFNGEDEVLAFYNEVIEVGTIK